MDVQTIKERVAEIEVKRESLVRLLDRSDLGALRIDVSQAIEEIDDLLEEFKRTFDSSIVSKKDEKSSGRRTSDNNI
ncbi:MAG: hypothetical protein EAZ23_20395 [Oscillatoriales cyanobacterium]|nr:MAG: hypothetical protein EAZ23_20395 [Oscillatoriales cyanobacterium]